MGTLINGVTRSVNDKRCHVVTVTGPRMSHIRSAGELVGLWIHRLQCRLRETRALQESPEFPSELSESCEKETFANDVPTTSFLLAKVGVILQSTINVHAYLPVSP